ncbi:MAG: hypothetical protein PQJ61_07140 [Spirochaetales bacterium]|uniref:Uncharacterized protein n=1 Tax=Candidatus Thalassospirochaeta sargassi TaxID=3119039 RepID=A0AAJ1IET5_9SPIO|nr:hypothetical protein [Spirochaetales bacterium]
MMPPMILRIRIRSADANFSIFIPLLLFYILLLPIFIIAALVYAFMLLLPQLTKEARNYMRVVFHAPKLLNAAKGMEVDIESDDADVKFYIK